MTGKSVLEQWLAARHAHPGPHPPWVMGVVNVTPDSFSDGGLHLDPASAVAAAHRMAAQGAHLIDIGAESTRPGSLPVSPAEQLSRLDPVLERLAAADFHLPITIDTTSSAVAQRCLALGAAGINDVSAGLQDPEILPVTARAGAAYIAMHMLGTPQTMQSDPRYPTSGVVAEVTDFLLQRLTAARNAGIRPELLLADPGIGFGKTLTHNLQLLRQLPDLIRNLGVPLLVGTSRKRFLGTLTGKDDPNHRLPATAASVAWAVAAGAAIVRVHDVAEMRDVTTVIHAIRSAPDSAPDR